MYTAYANYTERDRERRAHTRVSGTSTVIDIVSCMSNRMIAWQNSQPHWNIFTWISTKMLIEREVFST